MAERLWYVAYGSNMARANLARYLPTGMKPTRVKPITLPHRLYFAGHSKTWGGAVAFVSLRPVPTEQRAYGRAFELEPEALLAIARGENGAPALLEEALEGVGALAVGEWLTLPVELDEYGYRGKYNAVLRLPDMPEGGRAYTITTARRLPAVHVADDYLRQIRGALREIMPRRTAHAYVSRALTLNSTV